MKKYFFCITSAAYATKDTTRIFDVYKPDFSSLVFTFCPNRKLEPVYLPLICGRARSSFLSGQ